jgi:hypothetical protein
MTYLWCQNHQAKVIKGLRVVGNEPAEISHFLKFLN